MTDAFVLHQDWPASGRRFGDPLGVRDFLVSGHAVMLCEGYDVPTVFAQSCGHCDPAEAAVNEEL
ncbi:MAG TPA: hypothetical protein VFE59_05560, partial [Trebonia sp.]|nr:hypothetical protein [Trebonia sp.]